MLVTDPFEKHVTRTMDALKKSVERAGCTMDSIIHLTVFLCLPLADTVPTPTGKARFDAHKAQYDALNKIYGTYFSPGKAPSRACMALEWIPGDSLIEIVGSALVVTPPQTLHPDSQGRPAQGSTRKAFVRHTLIGETNTCLFLAHLVGRGERDAGYVFTSEFVQS